MEIELAHIRTIECLFQIPLKLNNIDGKDLNLIKEALFDFMKTTCIKFVPRSNEADYVVFMEYNQPNQEKRLIFFNSYFYNLVRFH